jgi:hypothetical protein
VALGISRRYKVGEGKRKWWSNLGGGIRELVSERLTANQLDYLGKKQDNDNSDRECDVEPPIQKGAIATVVGQQRASEVLFQVVP